jgi:hypothetical protein
LLIKRYLGEGVESVACETRRWNWPVLEGFDECPKTRIALAGLGRQSEMGLCLTSKQGQ